MPKVIIALLILMFSFIFLLFLWIIVLTVSLLVFTKKGKKGTGLHPETKGD